MLQEVAPALWSTTKTSQSRIFPLLFQGSCLTYITPVYLTSHFLPSNPLVSSFNKFLLLKYLLWAEDAGILCRVRYGQVVAWWLPHHSS